MAAALAERARREQAAAAAKDAVAAAKADVAAKQSQLATTTSELNDRWASDFTIASLKPLTPEQLCWTVFRVTGVYDRYWQTEVAELDKAKPLTDEQKKDPKQLEARDVELEQRTYDKLKGNIGTFVAFYGAAAGQPQGDFFATADQALFAANGGSINSWVAPAGGNVTERIAKQEDARVAAEDLYLSVFTRMPTDDERAEVANYLEGSHEGQTGGRTGACLGSAEFGGVSVQPLNNSTTETDIAMDAKYACKSPEHTIARRQFLGTMAAAGAGLCTGGLGVFSTPAIAAAVASPIKSGSSCSTWPAA